MHILNCQCGFKKPIQQGFTLIEILVTIVILSLGLLTYASLQALTLSNNIDSYHRTIATLSAYDLLDMMRANRQEAIIDVLYDISMSDVPPAANSTENAKKDLRTWLLKLQDQLPSGDGQVETNNRKVKITIQWRDKGRDAATGLRTFVVETEL